MFHHTDRRMQVYGFVYVSTGWIPDLIDNIIFIIVVEIYCWMFQNNRLGKLGLFSWECAFRSRASEHSIQTVEKLCSNDPWTSSEGKDLGKNSSS